MPLPQDEAGETDRVLVMLKAALERVRDRMEKAREARRVNMILDALELALTPAEYALVRDVVPARESDDLAGLRAERDALVKAIDALGARLRA